MSPESTSTINANDDLPFDFGEFSLRSIGVTINVPDAVAERYADLVKSLFATSQDEDGAASLKSYFAKLQSANERFIAKTYSTVMDHERRHFHDFLGTPFGATIMRDMMLAARYFPVALNQLLGENVIALPLQSWSGLSPQLHEIYQKQFAPALFNQQPPRTMDRLTQAVINILNRVQASFTAAQPILEASALCIQIEQIEELYGYEEAVSFAETINKMDNAGAYTKMWTLFNNVTNEIDPEYNFSPMVANAILLYGLCGNSDGEEATTPNRRIEMVLGYLLHAREIATDDNIWDILNHCSSVFQIPTIEESLAKSVADSKEFVQALRHLGEKDSATLKIDVSNKELYDCYEAWITAHEYMAKKIGEDPAGYCEPVTYLKQLENWVATPVYIAAKFPYDNPVVKKGWETVWGMGDGDNIAQGILYSELVQQKQLQSGTCVFTLEEANMLSQTIWMIYTIWSRNMLRPMHRSIGRSVLNHVNPEWKIHLL